MNPHIRHTWQQWRGNLPRCAVWFTLAAVLNLSGVFLSAHALEKPADAAAALQAKRMELQPQLRNNAFGQPLHLSSREGENRVEGDVYAEIAHPASEIGASFKSAATVCELLFLHLNVRGCQPSKSATEEKLTLTVGPKRLKTSGQLYHIAYALRVEVAEANYFRATLTAAEGPLSTRDYRIVIEAMPIDSGRAFIHLGYAYSYGQAAKAAMGLYLATKGRSKIGFTVTGQGPDGKPQYVGGERGSLERNVIRYYLALLAYHSVSTGSPREKMEQRLRKWFALTERYPAQLHELDLNEYLEEKRADLTRATAGRQ